MDLATGNRFLIMIQWGKGMAHIESRLGYTTREGAITVANSLGRLHKNKHKRGVVPTFIVYERIGFVQAVPAKPNPKSTKEIKVCYADNCLLPLGHEGEHYVLKNLEHKES